MERNQTVVPTSGMTFERQIMIIRAYVVLSNFGANPVQYLRVVETLNVARSQISGVNSFFVGLGLLEQVEEGTYIPTACAVDFYSQIPGSENFERTQSCLRESNLYHLVRNAILIRGSMQMDDIITEVLRVSETSSKSRAKRALEWLTRSNLINVNNNGSVTVN